MGKFSELIEDRVTRRLKVNDVIKRSMNKQHPDHEEEHDYTKDEPTTKLGKELAKLGKDIESRSKHESTEISEEVNIAPRKTSYHKINAVPGSHIRVENDHKEKAKALKDGASNKETHHLITHYKGEDKGGASKFVTSHREGDVVHFREIHSGKHVATISHSDL